MKNLASALLCSALIGVAYAGSAFGVEVDINPGAYMGKWVLDDGVPRQGEASVDLAAGTHAIRVAGTDDILFEVDSSGWVTVHNSAAAGGWKHKLWLRTTTVSVNPVFFTGNWRVSAGGTVDHIGAQSVVLVRGVRFYSFEVGGTGGFFFHVASDGTVSVENPLAASGGAGTLTLNNTERFVSQ